MSPNLTVIAIYLLSIITTQAQQTQSIDDLLKEILTTERPATVQQQPAATTLNGNQELRPSQPSVSGRKCGEGRECVERFLCGANGTVIRNGATIINIRIAVDNPCGYLEVCCSIDEKLTEPSIPIQPAEIHEGCGYRNPSGVGFRITGDENGEAEFGEFPWMVAIFRYEVVGDELSNVYECGGSVVAPNVVLTAAHCARNVKLQELVARAGEWDIRTTLEVLPHQDARVKEVIRHENFNKGTLFNDVALFILETPFTYQDNVRPICLPESNANFDYSRCIATGWGKDKFDKGEYQAILKKMDLPTVAHDTCQANLRKTRLGRYFRLHQSFICAGGEEGRDTCQGDGGSPLVCPDPNNPKRYYQAGIVAWGIGCGVKDVPGVYVNVAHLRNWINQKLAAFGIDSNSNSSQHSK